MNDGREKLIEKIERFVPFNEQEERDRALILSFIRENENAFLRENKTAHMTASAWIVNRDLTKVLMCYHNIYDSWSWTGGHADGETELLNTALREAGEETGVREIKPVSEDIFSLEILTVDGHEKRGEYVSSHLHMNVTYLLEADEREALTVCEGENSAVGWFTLEDALKASTEPWFVKRIYSKLNEKLKTL